MPAVLKRCIILPTIRPLHLPLLSLASAVDCCAVVFDSQHVSHAINFVASLHAPSALAFPSPPAVAAAVLALALVAADSDCVAGAVDCV